MATLKEMRDAANAWAAKEKADIVSGKKKIPTRIGQSMPKPVKTALVREIEPGRSRLKDAASIREARSSGAIHSANAANLLVDTRMQSAAETGEAQAFVGVMKGEPVSGAHKAQGLRMKAITQSIRENRSESTAVKPQPVSKSKTSGQRFTPRVTVSSSPEMAAQTKSNIDRPHKDIGRIATGLIRNAGEPNSSIDRAGGSILKAAAMKARGQKAPKASKKGISGSAPRFEDLHGQSDLTTPPGWTRKLVPGDL